MIWLFLHIQMEPRIRTELIKNWRIVNEINKIYPKLPCKLADYCCRKRKPCKPLCKNCVEIKKEEDKYKALEKERETSNKILDAEYGSRAIWASIKVDGYETNAIGTIEVE